MVLTPFRRFASDALASSLSRRFGSARFLRTFRLARHRAPHRVARASSSLKSQGVGRLCDRRRNWAVASYAREVTVLSTRRMFLEPLTEQCRERSRGLCANPVMMRYVGSGEPWSAAQADTMIDRALVHRTRDGFGCAQRLRRQPSSGSASCPHLRRLAGDRHRR
jgi:hypothetical protein